MKKIFLVFFLVAIVFSAKAQDKLSKKETIKLIESILNDYSAWLDKREYSIKDDKMIINNVTLEFYQYYDRIHWDQLEFKGTAKYKEKDGYIYLGFSITYNYYEKFSSNDEPDIKYGDTILFVIREDKVDALKNAFLRLKEIHK